jgi:hypothetical protein
MTFDIDLLKEVFDLDLALEGVYRLMNVFLTNDKLAMIVSPISERDKSRLSSFFSFIFQIYRSKLIAKTFLNRRTIQAFGALVRSINITHNCSQSFISLEGDAYSLPKTVGRYFCLSFFLHHAQKPVQLTVFAGLLALS